MRNVFLANTYKYGVFALFASACFASSLLAGSDITMTSGDACTTKGEVNQKMRTLQMPFIANNGQVDAQVNFYAKTFGGTVFVTKEGEIVYTLPGPDKAEYSRHEELPQIRLNRLCGINEFSLFNTVCSYINAENPSNAISRFIALKETLLGAKIGGTGGGQPAVTKVNYYLGNDKSKWRENIPTFNTVSLGEVYHGVELCLKAYGDNVEKLFCVKPDAVPEFIKVQLDGGKSLRVNQEGQLEVDTELGVVKFTKPIAYQEVEGQRVDVECKYTIAECGARNVENKINPKSEIPNPHLEYGFTVASYDKTKDLVIDPLLASTFLGGSADEYGNAIAIDLSGGVYVTGWTKSTNFPTTSGVYDTSYNGIQDVFVSKLNSSLTTLTASTYLGGSGADSGNSIALDSGGYLFVTGQARSRDFPTTPGAYNTAFNGGEDDTFVIKLNSGLVTLVASTYLGGNSSDSGNSIAINLSDDIYVTGQTRSKNFPTSVGAYDSTQNMYYDVFVTKLNNTLTSMQKSTFLGGSGYDYGKSLLIDSSGSGTVYVAGHTSSNNFPTTGGAYDTSFGGYYDVFVSKLDVGLTTLGASTYLGGSRYDYGNAIAFNSSGSGTVYVAGYTSTTNFPTTGGAYDTSFGGGYDAFVSKLNVGLTSLTASTFLGGSSYDYGNSLAIDASGNVYVTGYTSSRNFPTTAGASDTSHNGLNDAFVSKLNSGLTTLSASTFLGGSSYDYGNSLAIDGSGNVYVTGQTKSKIFPTTTGVYDTSHNGIYDVFITKLDGSNL